MNTIYLGRDNTLSYRLEVDGAVVPDDVITRVQFILPAAASTANTEIIFDTDDDDGVAVLAENATVLKIKAGAESLRSGRMAYIAKITVYDNLSPNGIAWDDVTVYINDWPPEA